MRNRTAIAGFGTTAYGRRGEFADRSPVEMIAEAFDRALEDSGLARREVDGFASYAGEACDPSIVAASLGVPEVRWASLVFGGGGGGCYGAIAHAAAAIASGQARAVAVYRALTQPASERLGAAYARGYSGDSRADFHRPFGLLAPGQMCAMIFRRHMHLYGTTSRQLAEVAVAERSHAIRNPRALHRTPLTVEAHQSSRMISDPFRLYDYCQENDGAAVILVTSSDRARSLAKRPVRILAAAHGGESRFGQAFTMQSAADDLYATSGHRTLAKRLYEEGGVGPEDVDVALLYDHFSGMVILQLEDYGFCGLGEGGPFVESGAICWPEGRLPVNTHGGHLSEAYLLGLTHVIEGVRQLRGDSTAQVKDAEIALVSVSSNLPASALLLASG